VIGNWNFSSLTGKELVEESKPYSVDVIGISSTKGRGSDTAEPYDRWKLFYSNVSQLSSPMLE